MSASLISLGLQATFFLLLDPLSHQNHQTGVWLETLDKPQHRSLGSQPPAEHPRPDPGITRILSPTGRLPHTVRMVNSQPRGDCRYEGSLWSIENSANHLEHPLGKP